MTGGEAVWCDVVNVFGVTSVVVDVTLQANEDACTTGVQIGRPHSMIGVGKGGCISISVGGGVCDVDGP